MKKPYRLLLLPTVISTMAATLNAQSVLDHLPRDGDRLHPGTAGSRALILSEDDSTRTVLLKPDAVSYDCSRDASVYIDGDTVSYVQFATKHRFILHSDSLSYLGYENRATDFRLDSPVTVAVFPLRDGYTVSEEWSGHLFQYGSMMLRHVRGTSSSTVEGGWSLLDGTDTLRDVRRLTWILDMSYADPDSVSAAMPDSVASDIISEMRVDVQAVLSERLLTGRTLWFTDGARYPVLTDSRISKTLLDDYGMPKDTVPLGSHAMFYPASYQYSDTGEEVTARKPDEPTLFNGEYGIVQSDTVITVSVGEPEVSGEIITVTLGSMSGAAYVTVTLFSDTGIRLTEPLEISVGTVPQPYSFTVPTGWTGVVILRVDAGEESYTWKTII